LVLDSEIVRRDRGRHADGDAGAAVDEEVREARRENDRLGVASVVVVAKVDRVLVQLREQLTGSLRETRLRVAHRRGRIAIGRAEVALTVHERDAEREALRHAHEGLVDRRVAVRVILAHHVADDAGALHELLVPAVPALLHAVEDPALHRLHPVAHVWQRAGGDHAEGVVQVSLSGLFGERGVTDLHRGGIS
jgi:hypothetical protein